MSETTIKITTTTKKSFWSGFINKNRYNEGLAISNNLSALKLDLSDCTFMEPFHLVSLACLIEEYYLKNIKIEFVIGNNLELTEFLTSVNFFNYWSAERNVSIYIPANITTTLSLWKISDEMISGYASEAQKYFEGNYLHNKNLLPLATSLSELFLNISDHSQSLISGFCLTQYYPNVGKIKFSVCDFGIGIPNSINNYLRIKNEPTLNDIDCLIKAFEFLFTTQSTPRNRGRGLDTIKTIIEGNNGILRVISNSACYVIENGVVQHFSVKESFNGTHFELILDVKNLTEKTEDLEDFDFN